MYQIGQSTTEITVFKEKCGMLGYGRHWNYITGQETPQFARCFIVESKSKKMAIVNVEFCFSTVYLKHGIVQALQQKYPEWGYSDDNLMITAQHTHSMAGGYTQHFFYNLFVPGFKQEVYDAYVAGIVQSILEAEENKSQGRLYHHAGEFADDIEVCFNRSLAAYNRNKEVKSPLGVAQAQLACNRRMDLLRIDDAAGQALGAINWFGVHATSVSNQNEQLCHDNKGYAAAYFEDYLREVHQVKAPMGIFAQEAAGDVTPNFIWDKKQKRLRGKYTDDFKSARYNGRLQFEKAKELFEAAAEEGEELTGELDYIQAYFDLGDTEVKPAFTEGKKGCRTAAASVGMAFLEGTREGPGTSKVVGFFIRIMFYLLRFGEKSIAKLSADKEYRSKTLHMYESQYPKAVVIELGKGRVMTYKKIRHLPVPNFVDVAVKYVKQIDKMGYTHPTPWIAQNLPLQIFIIGQLAIVGIPAEITSMAGNRLRQSVAQRLKERGVDTVILAPYANGYAGYITTYEEYQEQAYEGGHTLFGKWTLGAYQSHFDTLAEELLRPETERCSKLGDGRVILKEQAIWTGFDNPKVRVWK